MSVSQNIVAIYCRISKEDFDKLNIDHESESIQNQKLLLMDYATQNNFIVYKIYSDEDFSGFSDRPQFKKMIIDAQKGLFNIVLCKHQSRFTRDMELVERYIHGNFIEWGIRFISITDHVDTNVKGNKKARQIYGLINEWYSEDLSENIRAVFKRKMQDGQFLGSFASYGYIKDPNNRHKIIIDEEAAKVVREIFSLYLQGNGTQKIALILTQRRIMTPTQYKKKQGLNFANPNQCSFSDKYGAWSNNTIRRILRNEVYIGTLIQGREKKISYKNKKMIIAPKNEWIIHKNNHIALIEEQSFYTVQSMIKHKRTQYSQTLEGNNKKPHLLSGKVICENCGATMQRSGKSRDKETYYLRCKTAAKTKNAECTPHCIRQDAIETSISTKIKLIIETTFSKKEQEEILDIAFNKLNNNQKNLEKLEKTLFETKSKIECIKKNMALAYAEKLNGIISETDFKDFKKIFEDEKEMLQVKKIKLDQDKEIFLINQNSKEDICSILEIYKTFDKLTHAIINDFVYSISICERNKKSNEQEIIINWAF